MLANLTGKKVAILATDGFEQIELTRPWEALTRAGAKVEIVSPKAYEIQGFNHLEPGEMFAVDKPLDQAKADDYDALVIPGGVFNPDQLRTDDDATHFARAFIEADKPVAAICHAPWVLIDAEVVAGRVMTAVKPVRTDLANAGANVVDEEVVVDGHLITSRGPDDLPAFCDRLIRMVAGEPLAAVPEAVAFI
jgi:protease I